MVQEVDRIAVVEGVWGRDSHLAGSGLKELAEPLPARYHITSKGGIMTERKLRVLHTDPNNLAAPLDVEATVLAKIGAELIPVRCTTEERSSRLAGT